jgi:hypothetical protein
VQLVQLARQGAKLSDLRFLLAHCSMRRVSYIVGWLQRVWWAMPRRLSWTSVTARGGVRCQLTLRRLETPASQNHECTSRWFTLVVSTLHLTFFKIYLDIKLPSVLRSSKWTLCFRFPIIQFTVCSLLLHMRYVPSSSCPPWVGYPSNVRWLPEAIIINYFSSMWVIPGGSGTTARLITQITYITQNHTML